MPIIEHIPGEYHDRVEAYIRKEFPEHVELMMMLVEAWWRDYRAQRIGHWHYWWRNAAVETDCELLAAAMKVDAETVDRAMLELARTRQVSVMVQHNILEREIGQRCYVHSPGTSEMLLAIGMINESEYKKHKESTARTKKMFQQVRALRDGGDDGT